MRQDYAHVERYATWIVRCRWWIAIGSLAVAAIAALVAARLAVYADFSHLLPQSARSVRDLRAIEQRARAIGTAMIAIEAPDPVARRRAAVLVRDQVARLPEVASVTFDHSVERRYGWQHRWLFAKLDDLVAARDGLRRAIAAPKNPLYVELDDDRGADELRAKLREAEATARDPGELVSRDGMLQIVIARTAVSAGDVDHDRRLLARLAQIRADTMAQVPGVDIGVAGDVVVSVAEHDAILDGMLLATLVTVTLVVAALIWFLRSLRAVAAVAWSLAVGTLVTFAFTDAALGYLNLATAFLSSIVIGNGINAGILVTARYLEELRAGRGGADAIARTLAHTLRGTLTAALTAAIAYGSLVITVFRGFRHFGIIGSFGILACWCSAYLVLPAVLAIARDHGLRPRTPPPLGRWLAHLVPRRPRGIAIAMGAVTAIAAAITVRYIAGDPFESNFKNLRSRGATITEERRWMHAIDAAFGEGLDAAFVIAAPQRADVAPLVEKLRAVDRGRAERDKLFASVHSLDDLLPDRQPEKLAVLREIRTLVDSADNEEARQLRPPDDLRPLGDADIPEAIAWPFIESDGSRGKLILATAGPGYEVWDAHDTVRFADNVRTLDLPPDVHLGGASFVFADVLDAVLTDGPRATLAALAGSIVIVLVVLGPRRHGVVTIACGIAGTLLMLAFAAVLGLRVNFLDFVALPITIGIGIEYSANIATRAREEGADRIRDTLATTGAAVALCSYTTIVGYGSLLLSQNMGIRSFGAAAMLGELCCLAVAIVLAPALLSRPRGGPAG